MANETFATVFHGDLVSANVSRESLQTTKPKQTSITRFEVSVDAWLAIPARIAAINSQPNVTITF
jgi:hypothetical protein